MTLLYGSLIYTLNGHRTKSGGRAEQTFGPSMYFVRNSDNAVNILVQRSPFHFSIWSSGDKASQ